MFIWVLNDVAGCGLRKRPFHLSLISASELFLACNCLIYHHLQNEKNNYLTVHCHKNNKL